MSSTDWGIVAGLLVAMVGALMPILLPIHEKLATIVARTALIETHTKQLSDHETRITALERKSATQAPASL